MDGTVGCKGRKIRGWVVQQSPRLGRPGIDGAAGKPEDGWCSGALGSGDLEGLI